MAHPCAPLLELRLDLLHGVTEATLVAAVMHFGAERLVLTHRAAAEAGPARSGALLATNGDAEPTDVAARRRQLRLRGHALGVAYLDVELSQWRQDEALRRQLLAPSCNGARPRPQIVASYHRFDAMPCAAVLRDCYAAAAATGADVCKLAAYVDHPEGARPLMALRDQVAATAKGPHLLPIALGAAGAWSRLWFCRGHRPAPLLYVALQADQGTALQQPVFADVIDGELLGLQACAGQVYGVMGSPVGHSRSPLLHNKVMRAYGHAGVYLSFEVPLRPRAFVRQLAPSLQVAGLSVTLPHKKALVPACAAVDAWVRRGGALNTLVRTNVSQPEEMATYRGLNTDGPAVRRSLRRAFGAALAGRRCLVLGTGGTAALVVAALVADGAKVAVWGRRDAAAQRLAHQGGATAVASGALSAALGHAEVLVQCTPVGMAPDVNGCLLSPRQLQKLPAEALVFDCIYTPAATLLLRRARRLGLRTQGGREMFVRQAQGQCAAFYGIRPPLQRLAVWTGLRPISPAQ